MHKKVYLLEVLQLAAQVYWQRESLGETIGCTPEDRRFWGGYCRLLAKIAKCIKAMQPGTQQLKLARYRNKQFIELAQEFRRANHERIQALRPIQELEETFGLAAKHGAPFAITRTTLSDLQGFAEAAARDCNSFSVFRLVEPLPALNKQLHASLRQLRLFILMWAREIIGRMDAASVSLVSQDYLEQPDLTGQTAVHVTAEHAALDALPNQLLTEKHVLARDFFGWTPLHYAASTGHLDQLPEHFLTPEALLIKNEVGWNSVHLAFAHGYAQQLPSTVLTPAVVAIPAGAGANCLHLAAMNGTFTHVPEQFQTLKNVLLGDHRQQTCLHYAAAAGHLREFPTRFKSLRTLYIRDAMGRSSVDYAKQHARIKSSG